MKEKMIGYAHSVMKENKNLHKGQKVLVDMEEAEKSGVFPKIESNEKYVEAVITRVRPGGMSYDIKFPNDNSNLVSWSCHREALTRWCRECDGELLHHQKEGLFCPFCYDEDN